VYADTHVTSNMDVYERWAEIITVYFEANGGNITTYSKTVVNGKEYGDLPSADREGHKFDGWFTNEKGGDKITDETIFTGDSDSTLYAHWTVKQYHITFNTNGGSKVDSMTVDYNAVLTIPTNVTKDGYVFEGWYLDKELKEPMDLTRMPAYDLVLYAKWTEVVEVDAGVIIAIVICSTILVLGLAYIALACFCSACAFHSMFGKMNIFNYFECGKTLMAKFNKSRAEEFGGSSTGLETFSEAPSAPPTFEPQCAPSAPPTFEP